MTDKPSVLLVDDEEVMRDVISQLLVREGYLVESTEAAEMAVDKVRQESFDLVLLDLMLPGMGGLEALKRIFEVEPEMTVIMITAFASIENAVEATKAGAFDFVTKPFKNDELLLAIKNGVERRRLQRENKELRESLKGRYSFEDIVGKSDSMTRLFDLISHVGPSRSTVLITGESGTGKELVAKAIHRRSHRAEGPFVAVNSGNIPTELLESELFGHVKGAFTGATNNKEGLFEIASGGTIFLDEVGTIPLQTQSKLLRVIQEREFRRVGGLENIKVDVRIIAATNTDLRAAVEAREFREDLYYRLNVITVAIPPLRERRDDIPLLVEHFSRRYCQENERSLVKLDQEAMRLLLEYHWPGNVRELENVIERAVVLAPADNNVTKDLLPRELSESTTFGLGSLGHGDGASLKELVLQYEKGLILTALRRTNWNQKKAASLLKVNATTLNEKLKRLNIKHLEIPENAPAQSA